MKWQEIFQVILVLLSVKYSLLKLVDKAIYDAREEYIDIIEEHVERGTHKTIVLDEKNDNKKKEDKKKEDEKKEDKILTRIEDLRKRSIELEREQEELLNYVSNLQ